MIFYLHLFLAWQQWQFKLTVIEDERAWNTLFKVSYLVRAEVYFMQLTPFSMEPFHSSLPALIHWWDLRKVKDASFLISCQYFVLASYRIQIIFIRCFIYPEQSRYKETSSHKRRNILNTNSITLIWTF